MNTNKKVFEKLFSGEKTELTSQKFEFAIIDEFAKSGQDGKVASYALIDAADKAEIMQKEISSLQSKYVTQVANIKKAYANAEKQEQAQSKLYDKAKLAAAGLGMKIEEIKGYPQWWEAVNLTTKAIDMGDKYLAM
jgi:hypothetical protein